MAFSIEELVQEISPPNTVLILGAGASVACHAPSSAQLKESFLSTFSISDTGLDLPELAGIVELKRNRAGLINALRGQFKRARATGALLNLPLYAWKCIYTTNYDELVEEAYKAAGEPLTVYSSNFDFTANSAPLATKYFKIHGTIGKDLIDGNQARIVITQADYDHVEDYRETLYDRLKADMDPATHVVIIGQSLADPDLRSLVQRATEINKKAGQQGKITILVYEKDDNRANLLTARGLRVAFGGLDDFFAGLAKRGGPALSATARGDEPLSAVPKLRPGTLDVKVEAESARSSPERLFNGWPASYSDIAAGLTFQRDIAFQLVEFFRGERSQFAMVMGVGGVGKTTAVRQAALKLLGSGYFVWEHIGDQNLDADSWAQLALKLQQENRLGVLIVDEAHSHLYDVNDLAESLGASKCTNLKLVLISTRAHWGHRVKSPTLYSLGKEFLLSSLKAGEIDLLLTLVESNNDLKSLVESGFGGFSRHEKKRRLIDRCEADMFVCLKNIFASETFDDIILREYASLPEQSQEVYKLVAAMEYSGIRVHRQLVLRVLNISSSVIPSVLSNLADIVNEYDVNAREGVFGWKVRHGVIAGIITRYKFADLDRRLELFQKVVDSIAPTYDIEIRTIRELCNFETGISVIPDKGQQNKLLRGMMSVAPGERLPRHRLIRNLIELSNFETAETEIRIFEKDFGVDGPVTRYRILLMIARATRTPGLMREDRVTILEQARDKSVRALERYETKSMFSTYCEVGIETFKMIGDLGVFDDALAKLKAAEANLGDPELTRLVSQYQRRISNLTSAPADS